MGNGGSGGGGSSSMCPGGGGGGFTQSGYAAMSVNLSWYLQSGPSIAVYQSCQVLETASGTYFCMLGFNGGYMGIQDHPTGFGRNQRVIFSLWDQGGAPQLVYQGGGVQVDRFGGEGTGLKTIDDGVGWNVGETVSALILYTRSGSGALYAAYYLRGNSWKHLASIQVPGAAAFTGHYSFVEDFLRNTQSQYETRSCIFGPVWSMVPGGSWVPATSCRFGASYNSMENQEAVNTEDYGGGRRSLATGGAVRGANKLESVYNLAPGAAGPPTYLPGFPSWFNYNG